MVQFELHRVALDKLCHGYAFMSAAHYFGCEGQQFQAGQGCSDDDLELTVVNDSAGRNIKETAQPRTVTGDDHGHIVII